MGTFLAITSNGEVNFVLAQRAAEEFNPPRVLAIFPRHPQGSPSENSKVDQAFVSDLPVKTWNEYLMNGQVKLGTTTLNAAEFDSQQEHIQEKIRDGILVPLLLERQERLQVMSATQEWEIGDHGLAAIWKAEEPESFFAEHTGMTSDLKLEKRRIEFLAGRFLLKHLEADFPLHGIFKDEHDKPRIENDSFFFSISHSWPYIAAVIDPYEEAGIDIQTWHPRIEQIQHKFLSEEEQILFEQDPKLITLAWSAKEAVYKWNGKRGVDFIEHLPIEVFHNKAQNYNMTIYFKSSIMPKMISIENIIDIDFTCSYVTNSQDWAIY
jgi:phosphopantetheinyl transferase